MNKKIPPLKNGTIIFTFIAGLSFIMGLKNENAIWIGLCVCIMSLIVWETNRKFKSFMDKDAKLLKYFGFMFRSNPGTYIFLSSCWLIVLFWLVQDVYMYKYIKPDVFLGFISLYIVSSVVILVGYYKYYDDLS